MQKLAHNIEIPLISTPTKFWVPNLRLCDNPPQQSMPTNPLCYWRPLDSAIAGYYINSTTITLTTQQLSIISVNVLRKKYALLRQLFNYNCGGRHQALIPLIIGAAAASTHTSTSNRSKLSSHNNQLSNDTWHNNQLSIDKLKELLPTADFGGYLYLLCKSPLRALCNTAGA